MRCYRKVWGGFLYTLIICVLASAFALPAGAGSNESALARELDRGLDSPAADPEGALSAPPGASPLHRSTLHGHRTRPAGPKPAVRPARHSARDIIVHPIESVRAVKAAPTLISTSTVPKRGSPRERGSPRDPVPVAPAMEPGEGVRIIAQAEAARAAGPITKGSFIERFFVNEATRSPVAPAYLPEGAGSLPPAERYAAIVRRLKEKGVAILTGSRPGDSLTRLEFITLTYILAGGKPGAGLAVQKAFLKEKGTLEQSDIGLIKAYQGDVTLTREGKEEGSKVTGAEPVHFKDLSETDFGARVEFQFDDGSTLSMGEDTVLTIDEMVYDPKTTRRSIRLSLTVGTIRIRAEKNTHPESKFEVRTPALVAGIRGTDFSATVDDQGRTQVVTFEGAVGIRPILPTEPRPESRAEAPRGTRPGVKPPAPAAPAGGAALAQAAPVQEVLVGAGQSTVVVPGAVLLAPVQRATQNQIQTAARPTQITAPAKIAAVTRAETKAVADTIVRVKTLLAQAPPPPSALRSPTLEVTGTTQTDTGGFGGDLGLATNEVSTTGSVGDGALAGDTTPTSDPERAIVGAVGESLKTAFLSLTDERQADLFGTLTSAQQEDLLGRLTTSQAEALLATFQPSSPFTDAVLESLREFWDAAEAQPLTALQNALVNIVSAVQAEALIPVRPLDRIEAFYSGLAAAAQTAVLDDLSADQAGEILPGLLGDALTAFFNGLASAVRTIAEGDLNSDQLSELGLGGGADLSGLSGSALIAAFDALSSSDQTAAAAAGLTSSQALTLVTGRTDSSLTNLVNGLSSSARTSILDDLTSGQAQTLMTTASAGALSGFLGGVTASVKDAALRASSSVSQIQKNSIIDIPNLSSTLNGSSLQGRGMTYRRSEGLFYWNLAETLFKFSSPDSQTVTSIGAIDSKTKGLVFIGNRLFSVSQANNLIRELNPATGATIGSQTITIPSESVGSSHGLAVDPITGTLYGVVDGPSGSGRDLITINPDSGAAVLIGGTTFTDITGLAFDSLGTLYGIEGDGGSNNLLILNKTTGVATSIRNFPDFGGTGESIAFNPNDGNLYRASGRGSGSPSATGVLIFNTIKVQEPTSFLATIPDAQAAALLPGLSNDDANFFINGLSSSALGQLGSDLAALLAGISGTPLLDFVRDISAAKTGLLLDNLTTSQATEVRNCSTGSRDCAGKFRSSGANLRWISDTFTFTTGVNEILKVKFGGGGTNTINLGVTSAFISGVPMSADKLADLLKTRLQISNGNADTYTVTFDFTTKKFTITNDSGNALALDFLFNDSTSTLTEILGFSTSANQVVSVGASITGDNPVRFANLTVFGETQATALAHELDRLSGSQGLFGTASATFSIGSGSVFNVAREVLVNINPEFPNTSGAIADVYGGGLKPSAITDNGGFQAAQLRPTALGGTGSGLISVSGETAALNADGFLAYAVQVEEDIVNAAALEIRSLASTTFAAGGLNALVDNQLALSDIRSRDALLQAQADARAGRVFSDSDGNRVRVQQYVYRPPSNSDEVRMTSVSLTESTGLNYLDLRVAFQSGQLSGLSAINIRNLPWNDYFTFNYDVPSGFGGIQVGSPSGSPLLLSTSAEMGNGAGDYIREEMTQFDVNSRSAGASSDGHLFDSTEFIASNFSIQQPKFLILTVRQAGQAATTFTVGESGFGTPDEDFRAGSTLSGSAIPTGQYRAIPRAFLSAGVASIPSAPTDRPDYFHYVVNQSGTIKHYPVTFAVVGDATTSSTTGLQTSTCGSGGATTCSSLKFDNIWDAFRVNQPAGSQGLPIINIGANILQIQAETSFVNASSATVQVLSVPIRNFIIPWPRMIWNGESGF